jgi:arylsulfatase A-like enzyme
MSQAFEKSGYTTIRIGKIFHYNVPGDIGNAGHDDPDSWTIAVNPRGRDKIYQSSVFSLKPGAYGGTLSWKSDEGEDAEQTDGVAATEAVKFFDEFAETKKPFFMAVGLYRPHTPFVAPRKYFDLYDKNDIRIPEIPSGYLDSIPESARRSLTRLKEQRNLDPKVAKQAIQAYYASISFADAQIGRILDGLKRTGLDKNTIVVFTSDHGYHMGEHGYYQKFTLFENATRVPLIMSVPGRSKAGLVTDAPAELIDFYPTLTELAGVKRPAYLQGVSQQAALQDSEARPRPDAITTLGARGFQGWSLRTEKYRYTEWGDDGELGKELYDRNADPGEMTNVADQASMKELQAKLSARLRSRVEGAKKIPAGVVLLPETKRNSRK